MPSYLNISPFPLENSSRGLQNSKWTGCSLQSGGTLARSSRPQELFRNWRSGPPVIPRTGSVRAHARKTHARHCTLLLTWNKHQEDGFPWPKQSFPFAQSPQDPPGGKDTLLHTRNIFCHSSLLPHCFRNSCLHVSMSQMINVGQKSSGRAPWQWCHGRCCLAGLLVVGSLQLAAAELDMGSRHCLGVGGSSNLPNPGH